METLLGTDEAFDPSLADPRPGGAESSGDTGSALVDRAIGSMVRWNDARIARVDGRQARFELESRPWYHAVRAEHPQIRAEWDAFAAGRGQLPSMEILFEGYQGHIGRWWRAGPLVVSGRRVPGIADVFPRTTAALLQIPGVRYATWSLMGPQSGLPEHVGTNTGALRFLFAVDGGDTADLWIEGEPVPVPDGHGVLFDDTFPHRAWNPGPRPRAFLFVDLLRPLPGRHGWINHAVQLAHHHAIPRYRRTPARAAELFEALNSSAR